MKGHSDRLLARIVLSAFLSMGVMVCSIALYGKLIESGGGAELDSEAADAMHGILRLGSLALATPVMFLLGIPHLQAILALRRFLSADALVIAGTFSAWALSLWNTLFAAGEVYFETASIVLVLYTLGKWMDARAKDRAHARIDSLTEAEEPALRIDGASEQRVEIDAIRLGDHLRVSRDEAVPIDGVVISGVAELDASRLTGEEQSRSVGVLDRVLAGSRVREGELVIQAQTTYGERVRDEMDRLLHEALKQRAPLMLLADRAARILLPLVLLTACITAIYHWTHSGPEYALMCALSVVLISCPCALGIATPLAVWTALGEAWRRGILVRSGDVFERLARTRRVFFDKTGTLTSGEVSLIELRVMNGWSEAKALRLAAIMEMATEHPIGRAIVRAWRARTDQPSIGSADVIEAREVLPGRGIRGTSHGHAVFLGRGARINTAEDGTTTVALTYDGVVVAEFDFRAEARTEARQVLGRLTRRHLAPTILTGDATAPAQALALELGVPVQAELLPAQKVAAIQSAGPEGVLFVGDGINDAAALATADVGISVSGASAASLEAAEVNLLRADLSALPDLLDLARRTVHTARWNLAWAFSYNAIGLVLAATGRLTPIFAASAMVVSSALVVFNSLRLSSERAHVRSELRT
ncbi:MAG: heavy metal translocating P-type ATPase [Planctomycetota bacterium]|jgi:heavy metal translocating P-type ATPase